MTKKLTHEEFDRQVLEALEGSLPTGGGNKRPAPETLKALLERMKAKGMGAIK